MHQTSEGVCLLAVGWQSTGGAHGLRWLSRAAGGEAAGPGTPSRARRGHPWREGKGFSQRRETKLQCTQGLNEHLRPKILSVFILRIQGCYVFSSVFVFPLL